jgi:hypothetical protein
VDVFGAVVKSDDQKWNNRIENPYHCTKKLVNTFEMMEEMIVSNQIA